MPCQCACFKYCSYCLPRIHVTSIVLAFYIIGLDWGSLKEWKPFLWLAIPGVFIVCGEWWTFEIGGFVTGSIDGVQLAAYTITLNLASSGFVVS